MVALAGAQPQTIDKRDRVMALPPISTTVPAAKIADVNAEAATVGAVLANPKLYPALAQLVQPGDFYDVLHGLTWHSIGVISGRPENNSIDIVTVASELKQYADKFQPTGDLETWLNLRLTQLKSGVPNIEHAESYAALVREAAAKLRFAKAAADMAALAVQPGISITELTTKADALYYRATERATMSKAHIGAAVDEYIADLLNPNAGGYLVPTGVAKFDEWLGGGFRAGEFAVIVGNDGMGKTSLLLSIILAMIMGGYTVLHGSGEVEKPEIVRRMLTMLTGVTDRQMRMRQIPTDRLEDVKDRAALIKTADYHVVDQYSRFTCNHLRREAQRIIAEGGRVDAIFADGLWLMDADDPKVKTFGRPAEMSYITAGLKQLAKDFQCPVIAMQQYNGEIYKRRSGAKAYTRPTTYDIAESAAVRRDAQMIFLMHRPSFYDPDAVDENGTEFIAGKFRQDSSVKKGSFLPLQFEAQHSMYRGMEEEDLRRFNASRVNF